LPLDLQKTREGNLTEAPFPVLLDAIHRAGLSCALELSLRQLRKRILFEEGAPVACESNLLHETLGKRLVELGKLTEAQYQTALGDSIKGGEPIEELLVHSGLVTPYELYRQLQASLAQKILDCFRWTEATWKLSLDAEPAKSPLRMNAAKLVFTGIVTQLPFEIVSSQLELSDTQRYAAVATPPETAQSLKLAAKDQRFLQVLKSGLTFAELTAKTQLEVEPALRRLFALLVLGLVDRTGAQTTAAQPANAQAAPEPAAPSAPEKPAGVPFADDDPKVRDQLIAAFLEHRTREPFALLGVKPDVTAIALRQRFLELADTFSPVRFSSSELKEKAEQLLVAHARAFAMLADPEQKNLAIERRRVAEEKLRAPRPSTVEQFKIRTDLLDAETQYAEGRKRLKEGNPRGALEYFEYACDIDPKPRHRAWRAWARYRTDPARHARLAIQELNALMNEEGVTDEVFALAGQIHQQTGAHAEAESCFRRAYKLNPSERAYAEGIQAAMKAAKR
jgi:curved DNA-binding protein CbpA